MIVYLCLLLLIVLQGLIFLHAKNKFSVFLFFFLVWAELTCLAGIRSVNVARDTFVYAQTFRAVMAHIDLSYLSSHMEIGYLYFNKLVSYFSSSQQAIFFAVGGFYFYTFLHFIKRYSQWPFISVIIFFSAVPLGSYVFGMSFLRQALAVGCFLLGLENLLSKRTLFFIIWILLGSVFHKSAIICLVLLPLLKIPLNAKTLILIFLGTIVFISIFPTVLPHLPFGLSGYVSYMSKETSDVSTFSAFLKGMGQLYVTAILLYVYLSKQDTSFTTFLLTWVAICAFVCEFSAIRIHFMNRVLYFTVCNCVLIPYALAHLRRQKEFLILTVCFVLLFLFNNVEFWIRRAEREDLSHYETFWQNPHGVVRIHL